MRTQFVNTEFHSFRAICTLGALLSLALSAYAAAPFLQINALSDQESQLRKIGDYRQDLKAFMKDSKRDEDPHGQGVAIYNLCQLHRFLVADPRFPESQQLQGMRVVVANQLKEFAKDFKKQQLRESRRAKSRSVSNSELTEVSNDQSEAPPAGSVNRLNDDQAYAASLESYHAMGAFSGGPAQMFNYLDGRLGPPWDHGQELVDLIESTIDPASWRSNGGNGTIHYFRPLRVLVVGASSQVHDDTLELLRMLQRADGTQLNIGIGY